MARGRLLVALLLVLVGVGCGSAPTVEATARTTARPAPPDPGKALRAFVQAAGSGSATRMWALLSRPTRARFGPSLARFRAGVATELSEGVGSFAHATYEVVLAERITRIWAVAAIAGERTAEGTREYDAYAAALRLERGAWRVELGGPVHLRALRPAPGGTVKRRSQLAAELQAPAPVDEAGIWLDGRAVAGRYGGVSNGRRVTVFTDGQTLRPGRHTAVVFATAGPNASALGWAFTAR